MSRIIDSTSNHNRKQAAQLWPWQPPSGNRRNRVALTRMAYPACLAPLCLNSTNDAKNHRIKSHRQMEDCCEGIAFLCLIVSIVGACKSRRLSRPRVEAQVSQTPHWRASDCCAASSQSKQWRHIFDWLRMRAGRGRTVATLSASASQLHSCGGFWPAVRDHPNQLNVCSRCREMRGDLGILGRF